jgi:HEAT repeat protein
MLNWNRSKSPQNDVLEGVHSPDPKDRHAAVVNLGKQGSGPDSLALLKRIVEEDPDPNIRIAARKSYNQLKQTIEPQLLAEIDVLRPTRPASVNLDRLQVCLDNPNPIYRIEAVLQVIESRDEAAFPAIIDQLIKDEDEWVLATLVRAVGVLGAPRHVRVIEPLLDWKAHPRLIANTLDAICELDLSAAARLSKPFLVHPNIRIRSVALRGSFGDDPQKALSALFELVQSADGGARRAALHDLMSLKRPEADLVLVDVLAVCTNPDVERQIAEHLKKRSSRAIQERVRRQLDTVLPEHRKAAFLKLLQELDRLGPVMA